MCPNSSLHLVYSHILQIFIVLKYPIRKEGKRGKERERERRDGGRKERMEEPTVRGGYSPRGRQELERLSDCTFTFLWLELSS